MCLQENWRFWFCRTNMIVSLLAIEEKRTTIEWYKEMPLAVNWKKYITHFVKVWVKRQVNRASYQKQIVVYPTGTMTWYIHGFDHKFVEATKVWCHLVDGGPIFQFGTRGANCGNHNRVGNIVAFFSMDSEGITGCREWLCRIKIQSLQVHCRGIC